VDTESLCVLAGRSVWAIRLDIHILDNGGYMIISTPESRTQNALCLPEWFKEEAIMLLWRTLSSKSLDQISWVF
jgi:hypothetical protein